MTNWNQVGFDHYRSAPNGGIIWISPDDDRPDGYSIILNKDGETKELGFAEDLEDAKDIADRECRAMESEDAILGSYDGQVKVGDWKIEDKKLSWELETETTYGSEDISEAVSMIACAVNGNVKPLAQTIANLKTAIKDAEQENAGDDWEDSTIGGSFRRLDENMEVIKTAAKEAIEKEHRKLQEKVVGNDPELVKRIKPYITVNGEKWTVDAVLEKYAKEMPDEDK